MNKGLTGSALAAAVDKQTWDQSIKALTEFPSVLNNMAQNLAWTSQLGEDYHNQAQADVMTAIQTLRAKAKAAGQSKNYCAGNLGGAEVATGDRDPADKSPSRVRSGLQTPAIVYGYPYVVPAYVPPLPLVALWLLQWHYWIRALESRSVR